MTSNHTVLTRDTDDAALVQASRAGDRQAFGRIVARYQTLVCSLAYSATGSIARSQDIAQETFVAAWQRLSSLREPGRLRAWLCGIARNLSRNSVRRSGRQPVDQAEPLAVAETLAAPDAAPPQQAISHEEEAILWRALAEIPETYREPMILFYRQQQSVEAVARALELSEDAVKQRLSRGRVLLQEQVAAFVEGTLARTRPDRAFTTQVMSALPLLTTVGALGGAGGLAAKGGAGSKGTAIAVVSGAAVTAGLLWFLSFIGFVVLLGLGFGYVMSRASERSAAQRNNTLRFWRVLALGFAVFVLPGMFALFPASAALVGPVVVKALTTWLALVHALAVGAIGWWSWQWLRSCRAEGEPAAAAERPSARAFRVWLGSGLAVPAVFFVLFVAQLVYFHPRLTTRRIPEAEALRLIAERADATFRVQTHQGELRKLEIQVPEIPRTALWLPAHERALAALRQHGRAYSRYEYHEAPLAVRWLPLLSCFLAPAGLMILARRPWRQVAAAETAMPGRRENRVARLLFGATGLALLAGAVGMILAARWSARVVTPAEFAEIVRTHPGADVRLLRYGDGTSQFLATGSGAPRSLVVYAPADAAALALLGENRISYRTAVQGPDFGFRDPSPAVALIIVAALLLGAAGLLRMALQRPPAQS